MAGPYNIDESLAPEDPDYYGWHEGVAAAANDLHTRVAALEGASPDAPDWGDIGGTLADQTDLKNALDGKVDESVVDAKGDLLVGTAADTLGRVAVGSDGQVLTADSSQAGGVKWAAPDAPDWGDIGGTLSDQTDLQSALNLKAPLASPALTGNPTAPTPATGDNDTSIATTAFVKAQGYAPLASPALTGNPTAPTQSAGNDSTRLATTAFVQAAVTAGRRYAGINAQTGTTYTLVLTDDGKLVTCTNSGAITLTVPPNSSVAFPVGAQVDVAVMGAGMVTVTPGSGVTVNGTPSLVTRAQYSAVTLIKLATNTWLAVGDLADA